MIYIHFSLFILLERMLVTKLTSFWFKIGLKIPHFAANKSFFYKGLLLSVSLTFTVPIFSKTQEESFWRTFRTKSKRLFAKSWVKIDTPWDSGGLSPKLYSISSCQVKWPNGMQNFKIILSEDCEKNCWLTYIQTYIFTDTRITVC